MLFNSYGFLFCFLPLLLLCWQMGTRLAHSSETWCEARILGLMLLAFSAIFYGLAGLGYLCLFAGIILVNYAFGLALAPDAAQIGTAGLDVGPSVSDAGEKRRRWLMALALAVNLLPLVWFKYSGFILNNLAALFQWQWTFTPPGLPLGISFYTFIQIGWLVSVYRGVLVPAGITRHALFSAAFPYVISGPIVRYEQLGPQFDSLKASSAAGLARGFSLLSMGLAKKVLLADSIGVYADAVFNAAEKGFGLSSAEAWLGSLCYTFQLYFDFSGYTDMVLGIGLMLGLRLPENFNSPYKATGIVDFWRRWHISLGAWLRDFLYIPLGGNRKGKLAQYRNLFLVMFICGIWHGAGWTFMIWGALHGLMLVTNHLFRAKIHGRPAERILALWPMRIGCIALTFFLINLCWVIFRATTLNGAMRIYRAMFLGAEQPQALASAPDLLQPDGFIPEIMALPESLQALVQSALPHSYFSGWQVWALLLGSMLLCWAFPNSQEILSGHRQDGRRPWLSWNSSIGWAMALALLAFSAILLLGRTSTYLYFQF